ncbi:MAG: 50S ribosomal protein L21 [Candidatus Omnitrophica bacterium CG02_land_8_20_14_3_00__42_8]|nr:MAG: 50S ribosomal protein L21 [Candidatus Omnitrophica bacterium CG02_land_8_20_14_3_00__42_8]PIW67071.1 MAG: 50S ribosomal protein L21 [Candidatus Omnitrophica bacterium CG12_big_fil_rev_8_21_14_0_65_42_8]
MYAIVETGSKQYKVSKNDTIEIEKLNLGKAKEVKIDKVLFISDEKDATIGTPYIKGAHVVCDILGERRDKKVISFKYRRRHASSKKKIGHRQGYVVLKVKEINVS